VTLDDHQPSHHNMEANYLSEEVVTFPCMTLCESCQMVAQNGDALVARVAFLPAVKCLEAAAIP